MSHADAPQQASHSIAAVERETGLAKDTLRVWERRYGFPQPERDSSGERLYPLDQVNKLRAIKRLRDRGHRPAKIIHHTLEELQALGDELQDNQESPEASCGPRPDLDAFVTLCLRHQTEELRRTLSQALMRMGMQTFITEVLAPLNHRVGEHWARGTFAVFEEHLYTEVVQNLLRNAIATVRHSRAQPHARPRVMLTTMPQEAHCLGLLMAEAFFAMEGAHCVSLGVQTPITEIDRAARLQRADIVALSFSAGMNARQAAEGLRDLAAALPASTEIWIGGRCPALKRDHGARVRVVELATLGEELGHWRMRSAAAQEQ